MPALQHSAGNTHSRCSCAAAACLTAFESLEHLVQAGNATRATGEKYTSVTGRDSAHDGKVIGICAAATGAVIATGTVLSAASTLVTGAALAAAGTVGAAVYCKRNGAAMRDAALVAQCMTLIEHAMCPTAVNQRTRLLVYTSSSH